MDSVLESGRKLHGHLKTSDKVLRDGRGPVDRGPLLRLIITFISQYVLYNNALCLLWVQYALSMAGIKY